MAYAACRNVSDYGYQDCDANVVAATSLDGARPSCDPGPPCRPSVDSPGRRDARSLVFYGDPTGTNEVRLCRVNLSSKAVDTVDAAGITVGLPTTTMANDRLVFVRYEIDSDIVAARAGHGPATIAASSADEGMPSYAPDGRHIAFMSARTGGPEIGSRSRPARSAAADARTRRRAAIAALVPGRAVGGLRVSAPDGHMHVWTIGTEGAPLRQITAGTGDEGSPTLVRGRPLRLLRRQHPRRPRHLESARGRRAAGTRQHRWQRIPGDRGADGHDLLYQAATTPSALLLEPAGGGPPVEVVSCVEVNTFAWQRGGLYYIPCGQGGDPVVRRIPRRGRPSVRVLSLDGTVSGGVGDLAVSPDGSTILCARPVNDSRGGDLWMIDPFR